MVEQYGHFAVSPPSAGKSPPQFGQFVVWYKSFSLTPDFLMNDQNSSALIGPPWVKDVYFFN